MLAIGWGELYGDLIRNKCENFLIVFIADGFVVEMVGRGKWRESHSPRIRH